MGREAAGGLPKVRGYFFPFFGLSPSCHYWAIAGLHQQNYWHNSELPHGRKLPHTSSGPREGIGYGSRYCHPCRFCDDPPFPILFHPSLPLSHHHPPLCQPADSLSSLCSTLLQHVLHDFVVVHVCVLPGGGRIELHG